MTEGPLFAYVSQSAPAAEISCCDFSISAQMKESKMRKVREGPAAPWGAADVPSAPPRGEKPGGTAPKTAPKGAAKAWGRNNSFLKGPAKT